MEALRCTPKVYMLEPIPLYFNNEAADQLITDAMLKTLEQMGYNPSNVVFSGYHQSKSKEEAFQRDPAQYSEEADGLKCHIGVMSVREERGDYDDGNASKDKDLRRLAELKQAIAANPPLPTYYFGRITDFNSVIETLNPLHYARHYHNDAVIGVYDIAKLKELGLDVNDQELALQAEPYLVEEAKILEFHPRFEEEVPD